MPQKKSPIAAVFDCRTTIVGYQLVIIIIQLAFSMQYRRSLPYLADRSARYGKGRLHCMCVLYLHLIYTWLLVAKAWAANIVIEWLPYTSIWRDKLRIISTLKVKSQKSRLLVFHSACLYKNYYLNLSDQLVLDWESGVFITLLWLDCDLYTN